MIGYGDVRARDGDSRRHVGINTTSFGHLARSIWGGSSEAACRCKRRLVRFSWAETPPRAINGQVRGDRGRERRRVGENTASSAKRACTSEAGDARGGVWAKTPPRAIKGQVRGDRGRERRRVGENTASGAKRACTSEAGDARGGVWAKTPPRTVNGHVRERDVEREAVFGRKRRKRACSRGRGGCERRHVGENTALGVNGHVRERKGARAKTPPRAVNGCVLTRRGATDGCQMTWQA